MVQYHCTVSSSSLVVCVCVCVCVCDMYLQRTPVILALVAANGALVRSECGARRWRGRMRGGSGMETWGGIK